MLYVYIYMCVCVAIDAVRAETKEMRTRTASEKYTHMSSTKAKTSDPYRLVFGYDVLGDVIFADISKEHISPSPVFGGVDS